MSTLTLDQQHYFAYCAAQSALAQVANLDSMLRTISPWDSGATRLTERLLTDARNEWCGIERRCRREVTRLARIKHATP